MTNTITLSILDAFDYLYENNLAIDQMWVKDKVGPAPTFYLKREIHITTKPRRNMDKERPPK